MNRNFISVIAGGFGSGAPAKKGGAAAAAEPQGEVAPVSAAETAEMLREAKSAIIVPGYGMAVARPSTRSTKSPGPCARRASLCALPSTRWRAACPAT
jgi:NAD/NADP transhydrogenase beta subunit